MKYHDASALVPISRQRRGKCRCSVASAIASAETSERPDRKQEVNYETENLFLGFYCPESLILFDRRKSHV
jgi:hypothetical protein